jgi:SH3-like domain-containing protein
MSRYAILAAVVPFLAASGAALAIDYASVASPAILYETSSLQARKLAIIRAGTPVEIVVTSPDLQWVKVRDPAGGMAWIEGGALSGQRTVLVIAEQAAVRCEADNDAPVAFEVARDVVLELVSVSSNGWVKVRHADGDNGYLRFTEVWGL